MQKIVLRDQLLISMDKLNSLRNLFSCHDMHTIAKHSSEGDLWKMNRRSEETIVIINMLVRLLLWDLVDRFSEIG
jgi:hypothetical protein